MKTPIKIFLEKFWKKLNFVTKISSIWPFSIHISKFSSIYDDFIKKLDETSALFVVLVPPGLSLVCAKYLKIKINKSLKCQTSPNWQYQLLLLYVTNRSAARTTSRRGARLCQAHRTRADRKSPKEIPTTSRPALKPHHPKDGRESTTRPTVAAADWLTPQARR